MLPELSSAPNLLNLEVDEDLFDEIILPQDYEYQASSHLTSHAAGSRHCFSSTIFNFPFAVKTGFLFHLFTSSATSIYKTQELKTHPEVWRNGTGRFSATALQFHFPAPYGALGVAPMSPGPWIHRVCTLRCLYFLASLPPRQQTTTQDNATSERSTDSTPTNTEIRPPLRC